MNISDIYTAGKDVISLIDEYHNKPHREMLVDPILYALLKGRFGNMQRQHNVRVYGSKKPKRIDYRHGGTNPVVLEFAVRPIAGGAQLHGSQNQPELRKLCRVSATQAKLRALLLLDLSPYPLEKEALKNTYDGLHAGPGKFKRLAVRVVYVQRYSTYSFKWNPFKDG